MGPIIRGSLAVALATALPAVANAATMGVERYVADLTALNESGVDARAELMLDGDLLTVHLMASGLEPNQLHIQHIHGVFDEDGAPADSVTPPPSADTDADGFVELAEGLPFYGPIVLDFVDDDGMFPTAPDGTVDFTNTYDLSDFPGVTPLDLREIVIHGLTVPAGIDPSVPDGGYLVTLPIASGEITVAPVPLPAAGVLLVGALGALGLLRARRAAA